MTIDLADLAESLDAAVNPPGTVFVAASEDQWVQQLANAFWYARLRGFFTDFRTDVDGTQIQPMSDGGADPDRYTLQVIVLMAALNVLENKLLSTPQTRRAKAGPVESEVSNPATMINAILEQRREDLRLIRSEVVVGADSGTLVGVIDMVFARDCAYTTGAAAFVR